MVHHENGGGSSWPPIGAPLNVRADQLQHWTSNFDSSVNAVSFGFVATAILISMFLVMAIFERFLRPPSPPSGRRSRRAGESQVALGGKLGHPSPKMNGYGSWVSVLMPGEETPSFIAHPAPAPAPCSPERISWPSHQNKTLPCSTSNIPSNINRV